MTLSPATVDATTTVGKVLERLFELDVRHLPIVDDGRLVGIVSDRDLRDVTARLVSQGVVERTRCLTAPVADIMSSDVLSVEPETDLGEVVDLMIEHRVGALPVVASENDELVGIVSYVDVLRAARDAL